MTDGAAYPVGSDDEPGDVEHVARVGAAVQPHAVGLVVVEADEFDAPVQGLRCRRGEARLDDRLGDVLRQGRDEREVGVHAVERDGSERAPAAARDAAPHESGPLDDLVGRVDARERLEGRRVDADRPRRVAGRAPLLPHRDVEAALREESGEEDSDGSAADDHHVTHSRAPAASRSRA